MAAPLELFTNLPPGLMHKANELVEAVRRLQNPRGDDYFIALRQTAGGTTMALNIERILARIPKRWSSAFAIMGRVTDTGDSMTFTQQVADDSGNWQDTDDADMQDQPFQDANKVTNIPVGEFLPIYVLNYTDGNGDSQTEYWSVWCVGNIRAVKLNQTGGDAGGQTTQCSFTYDAVDRDGNTIASGLSPRWRPLATGTMTAATRGQISYDNGTWTLEVAYETNATYACDEPTS